LHFSRTELELLVNAIEIAGQTCWPTGDDRVRVSVSRNQLEKGPVAKHLWIQLAQDWIALAENAAPQPDRLIYQVPTKQLEPLEQMEPFLVA
jgi:hypothetical protein